MRAAPSDLIIFQCGGGNGNKRKESMESLKTLAVRKATDPDFIKKSLGDIREAKGGRPWDTGGEIGIRLASRVFLRRELVGCENTSNHVVDVSSYCLWASLLITHGSDMLRVEDNGGYFQDFLTRALNSIEPRLTSFDSISLALLRSWNQRSAEIMEGGLDQPPQYYLDAAQPLQQLAANYIGVGEVFVKRQS